MGHQIDGQLAPWEAVADAHPWRNLLAGNGLSRQVWPSFAYTSLYERACETKALTKKDRALFEARGTENFELVLSALATSIETLAALGRGTDALEKRYASVQGALGRAVRDVHAPMSDVPEERRAALRAALLEYRYVFTTSYDLLVYWAAAPDFADFADFFWSDGRNAFDPGRTRVSPTVPTRIAYLHGALHLVVDGAGVTTKRRSGEQTLLEQFDDQPPPSRPLLITEGSSADKLKVIVNNEYLNFALTRLRRQKPPLVVFGHALGPQDQHLVDALNVQPERPIAVGLLPGPVAEVRARQGELRGALTAHELYFYDATTHPLGRV
ncbi:MAG TPA: DUF4917 family protein [Baekduia sp.]|uniref:DUF4917 family protein n=1 Tax=Baekduia sp. TaxID=2600305 RepID=UPI002D770EF8|nr:DUF4917 family protein [Baekduia sp.]HET6505629.1 DUF4917 family protein [Baekduia sp.]